MLLEFAETQDKQPIHISRARPDYASKFYCPACYQPVIANSRTVDKQVAIPHFVHIHGLCHYIQYYEQEEHRKIPSYRDFEQCPNTRIATGQCSLSELYTLQQDAIKHEYSRLQIELQGSHTSLSYRSIDLKLFEWTVQKFSLFMLYFVAIQVSANVLYHIGSSDQPEAAYLAELSKKLPPADDIRVISSSLILPQTSSIEFYFQHRFRKHRYRFQNCEPLPDYFHFSDDVLPQVIEELQHLQYVTNTRRENIKAGMQYAKAAGKQIGRPSENPARFLHKKKSQEIAALLQKGLGIREVHRRTGYAINTVRKVNTLLQTAPSMGTEESQKNSL